MVVRNTMEPVMRTAILLLCRPVMTPVCALDEPVKPLPMPENPDERKVALDNNL